MKKKSKKSPLLQLFTDCGISTNYVYQNPLELPAIINWEFRRLDKDGKRIKIGWDTKDIYNYVIMYYFSRLGMGISDADIYLRPKDIITRFLHIPELTVTRVIQYLIKYKYLKKRRISAKETHLTLNTDKLKDTIQDYQKEFPEL